MTTAAASSAATPAPVPATVPQLERAIRKLAKLHSKLGKPKPGEWLDQHKEPGQTFAAWRAGSPTTPQLNGAVGARSKLYVQPLGPLTASEKRIVALTTAYLQAFFGLKTASMPRLPLSVVPKRARRKHPSWGVAQIHSGYVLESVMLPRLPRDAAAAICLTAHDLWPGAGWNFVFGQASLSSRVGVWSMHRFGDPSESPEAYKLTLLRTLKLAVHETGHMFSIKHCTAYECVMGGSNHLQETDESPLWLCPECMAKVVKSGKLDPVARYRGLMAIAQQHGFKKEAKLFAASIAALVGTP